MFNDFVVTKHDFFFFYLKVKRTLLDFINNIVHKSIRSHV